MICKMLSLLLAEFIKFTKQTTLKDNQMLTGLFRDERMPMISQIKRLEKHGLNTGMKSWQGHLQQIAQPC
jgi:hypothetical protein